VWYSVIGTGEITAFYLFADYDSWISIFEGENCDMLQCMNTNDDSPLTDGSSSVVAQVLEDGVMYFIRVHGYENAYGNFSIASEVLEPTANNDCIAAQPLELGVNVSSNSLAATGEPDIPFCGMYVYCTVEWFCSSRVF
jgi:hypothetical protein